MKQKKMDMYNKSMQFLSHRRAHLQVKERQLKAHEQAQLTFRPKINAYQPVAQFAVRNEQWAKKVEERKAKKQEIQELKKDKLLSQSCTFKPDLLKKPVITEGDRNCKKDITLYLSRQQKARKLKQVQKYRRDHPNWHVWNYRPKQKDHELDSLCRSMYVPQNKSSLNSSVCQTNKDNQQEVL